MPKLKRNAITFTASGAKPYQKYRLLKVTLPRLPFRVSHFLSLLCLIDCCGSDRILCGVHQNKAYCVWSLWTLSAASSPSARTGSQQVLFTVEAWRLFVIMVRLALRFGQCFFILLKLHSHTLLSRIPDWVKGAGRGLFTQCSMFC